MLLYFHISLPLPNPLPTFLSSLQHSFFLNNTPQYAKHIGAKCSLSLTSLCYAITAVFEAEVQMNVNIL